MTGKQNLAGAAERRPITQWGSRVDSDSKTQDFELETEMSPASQAPPIKTGMVSQGSQNLALGLAKTAASQLDEFVRGPGFLGKALQYLRLSLLVRTEHGDRYASV